MTLKLMLFSLVAMIALPMFMLKPDGKPIMAVDDWLPDSKALKATVQNTANKLRTFASAGDSTTASVAADEQTASRSGKMYSWKDENGVMHFSEVPPPSTAENVKVRDLPQGVNRMVALTPRAPKAQASGGAQRGAKLGFPGTIPHKDIPKLIEDAKQLQQLADQRGATLQSL